MTKSVHNVTDSHYYPIILLWWALQQESRVRRCKVEKKTSALSARRTSRGRSWPPFPRRLPSRSSRRKEKAAMVCLHRRAKWRRALGRCLWALQWPCPLKWMTSQSQMCRSAAWLTLVFPTNAQPQSSLCSAVDSWFSCHFYTQSQSLVVRLL